MMSSKGVIQGYTAVALVDGKHQIVVHAEAHGEGQEHGLLIPMIEGAREHFSADPFKEAAVLADAGYCSEANAQYLSEEHIDGYLADPMFRKRDPRFIDAARHKPTRPDERVCEAEAGDPLPAEGLSDRGGSNSRDLPGRQAPLSQRPALRSQRL